MPIMLAAAPLGAANVMAWFFVRDELATLGVMVALVLPARAGVNVIR